MSKKKPLDGGGWSEEALTAECPGGKQPAGQTPMLIPPDWNIPDELRQRLGQSSYGRQRSLAAGGHILLVLHKPPGPSDATREGVLFWRNPEGEVRCNRGGDGEHALRSHVASYGEAEHSLNREYESSPQLPRLFDLLDALAPLSRAARNMHSALQAARETAGQDELLIDVRNAAYEVERNLELLTEDTRNAIQQRVSRDTEDQAKLGREALQASHRLNILAAVFFPLTAMASIFGMNFTHGLDQTSPAVFWVVLACGVAAGIAVKGWVVPRKARRRSKRG